MRRRRPLLTLAALALLLALAIAALARTRLGLIAALRLAESAAGVEFTVRGLEGSPLSGLRAERLEVAWPEDRVTLDGLAAEWDLRLAGPSLAIRSLRVETLRAELAEVRRPESLPVVDPGLALALEGFEVERVEVIVEGEEGALRLTDLRGSAALADGVIEVPSLAVRGKAATVGGSLWIDTAANWRHRLELAAELAGRQVDLGLEGDLDETRVRASAPDLGTEVDGLLTKALKRPTVDLEVRSSLEPVSAALRLRGVLPVVEVAGSVGVGDETISVNGMRAEVRDDVLRLQGALAVTSAGIEVDLEESEVGLAADGAVRLAAAWRWDGAAAGPLGVPVGRLVAEGPVDALSVAAEGLVPIGGMPFDLALDALLSPESARVSRFAISGQGAEIALAGHVEWGEALAVDAHGEVRGLNPAVLWPDWPARIDGALAISGTDRHLEAAIEGLEGRFLGRRLRGGGKMVLEDLKLASASLALRSGRSRIDVAAPAWPEQPIRARFDLRDLGDLIPGVSGAALVTAEITPHPEGVEASAEITGSSMSWEGWSLASVDGEAALDLRPGGELSARLEGGPLKGPVDVDSLRFEATGRDRAFDFTSRWLSPIGQVLVTGSADLSGEPRVRLNRMELATRDFGDWALSEPAAVVVAGGEIRLEAPACLASAETRLCVDLPRSPGVPGTLEMDRFPLGLLDGAASAAAGRPVTLGGVVAGDFEWRLEDGQPAIDGALRGRGVEIALAGEGPLRLTGVRLAARAEEDLELEMDVAAGDASARLSGRVERWRSPDDAGLDLELDVDLPDLGELGLPGLPVEDLSGTVDALLEIRGRPRRPAVAGRLAVSGFGLFAPAPGLAASGGDLEILFDENGDVDISGRVEFEEGWVEIDGSALLAPSEPPVADIRVRVRDALLVERFGTRVQADADLELAADASGLAVTGEVGIEDSRIVLGPIAETVRPSPDVVYADQPEAQERAAPELPLAADVRIRALTPIEIAGLGLDAEVTGEVRITEHEEYEAAATGTFFLAGTFSRYGQAVEISRGRIVFARSSLVDPQLDVEATRDTESARVGVRVSGAATAPAVELFSEPPLAESEILSLLVFGYSLEDPTEQELGALSAALTGLRMGAGEAAVDEEPSLVEKLGFTQFGLTAEEDLGGAAFAVGRYLAPRLYLEYSIGLEESIDVLALWYRLSDHWAVGAETGEDTRGAVVYSPRAIRAAAAGSAREETQP
ncbi:MAG: hypothetical protein GY719_22345 [bacterium]|nr:hypothetical protein [bacterium]